MTVTNETSSVTHLGNGATTVWPYSFIILKAADAEVRLYDLLTDISTIVPSGEYTISGIGNPNGGDVTYAPGGIPLPATKRITISRLVSFTQETDLTNQTPYYPEVLEEQLDYMVMQTQQLKADMARAVLVQPGSPIDPNELLNEVKQDAAAAAGSANAAASSAGTAAGHVIAASQQKEYAEEWAQNSYNVPVSVAAGGDGATTFSALHHATDAKQSVEKAEEWANAPYNVDVEPGKKSAYHWSEEAKLTAASLNLPTPAPGDASKALVVNPAETGYLLKLLNPSIIRETRTSNTALTEADVSKFIDVTSGTFTQTLAAAATLGNGWFCYYRNSGTVAVTLDPNGSETIDGLTTFYIYPGQVYIIICTGTAFVTTLISGRRIFIAKDEKANGVAGGTIGGLGWYDRALNAVPINTINGVSLSSNLITVPAGSYLVEAAATTYGGVGANRLTLYNNTDSTDLALGLNSANPASNHAGVASSLIGAFTLSATKVLKLRHYVNGSQSGSGLGFAVAAGTNEVYAHIKLEKING